MPCPGYIFLGHIAGVVNYLWTSCAIIYFILLYNKIIEYRSYHLGINILLLLFGILIGSLQESFTIGISGALFVYYCWNLSKFKGGVMWLIVGLWIGTCIVVLAPGNFVRLNSYNEIELFSRLIKHARFFVHIFCDSKLLLIFLLFTIVLYFTNRSFIKLFLKKNWFYLLSMLFNIIIMTVIYTDKRQLTSVELFSMILLIKLIYSLSSDICESKYIMINSVIFLILLLLYIPIYKDREINYNKFEEIHRTQPINGVIIDKDIINYTKYIRNRITYNYTIYLLNDFNGNLCKEGLSLLKTNGENINYITSVIPISPNEISSQFDNSQGNSTKYIYDKNNKAYYFRFPKDTVIENIFMTAKPKSFLRKIKLSITKETYDEINIFNNIAQFEYLGYNYYAFFNIEDLEIHDFDIKYKDIK